MPRIEPATQLTASRFLLLASKGLSLSADSSACHLLLEQTETSQNLVKYLTSLMLALSEAPVAEYLSKVCTASSFSSSVSLMYFALPSSLPRLLSGFPSIPEGPLHRPKDHVDVVEVCFVVEQQRSVVGLASWYISARVHRCILYESGIFHIIWG
jgi:hypothetical protein